jgi:hypothetical protein
MTKISSFDAGYDVYWDHLPVEHNPYDRETYRDDFELWILGWREAEARDAAPQATAGSRHGRSGVSRTQLEEADA